MCMRLWVNVLLYMSDFCRRDSEHGDVSASLGLLGVDGPGVSACLHLRRAQVGPQDRN